MSLKVYRPVKSNHLNQGFGENKPCARRRENGTFEVITTADGTCPAGFEKFYPQIGLLGHNGYDNAAWHGEPLYFNVDCPDAGGWIAKEASDLDGGLGVDVVSKQPIMFEGQKTYIKFRFWHLKSAWKDSDVQPGELIGFCDNTGASSGDHLHWALKACNAQGVGINKNNGYYGAIDFTPYYENEFILDVLKVKAEALSAIDLARKVMLEVKIFLQSFLK
jgi:hypothetical protein